MKNNNYIKGLDGVRGFSALMIIAFHVFVLGGYLGQNIVSDRTLGNGGWFVQLFFMLSSFSLMYVYYPRYKNKTISWDEFYFKRFIRIVPLFLLAVLLYLFIDYLLGNLHNKWEIIGTSSLMFSLLPKGNESIVNAGWAMSIIFLFYIIFPFFLTVVSTKKRTLVTFIIAAILYVAYLHYYGVDVSNSYINVVRQFMFFVAGACVYHCIEFVNKIKNKNRAALFCYLIMIINIFLFNLSLDVGILKKINVNAIIAICSFASLIFLQCLNKDKICGSRVLRFLGSISFEMYIFHMFIYKILWLFKVDVALANMFADNLVLRYLCNFLLVAILTIIFSSIIHYIYSKITNKVIQKKLKRG